MLARVWIPLLVVLGLSGCASFGPTSVDRDRFDYIQAIATSWKQQTLFNIVKLRYSDTPVFLDVSQVIGSYQLQAGVSVGGGVNFGGPPLPNTLSLSAAGTYTDRPTVVYTPLTGAHFLKVLMTPIPPPALFPLMEAGWPADLLLQIGAQTVNGISNRKGGARGRAADPAFSQLLAALQRIQASGAVSLRTEVSKESKQEGVLSHAEAEGCLRRDAGRPGAGEEAARPAARCAGVQDRLRDAGGGRRRDRHPDALGIPDHDRAGR